MNDMPAGYSTELAVLERLAVPVMLVRESGEMVYANPAARSITGLSLGISTTSTRILPAATAVSLADVRDGEPLRTRITIDNGKGISTLDVRLSRVPAGNGEVSLLAVEGVVESAAHRELHRLTEQMVALSFGYPDLRFEVAHDGTILDFVIADPGKIALSPQDLVERRIQEALPSPAGELLGAAVARVSAHNKDDSNSLSFSLPGSDGEQFFDARLIEMVDGDRILITLRNVTDRVKAERRAARIRDRLVEALDSISEGFVLYDSDDRLVLFNNRYRELFDNAAAVINSGAKFEEVLRHPNVYGTYGISPEALDAWVAERLELHMSGGPPVEWQMSNGRWLRIEERITPLGDRVGLRSDITELKQRQVELQAAREAAERASQQKTGFVHHLSHELRTPLNAVLGFAQMIGDELLGPIGNPRYPAYARQIAEAGSYMLELINNLLDLAKIDAGRLPVMDEACDLPVLVELTLSMVGGRAERAGVTLVNRLPALMPQLIGDASLIRQMLTNLIANSIKFCPPDGGGTVEVGAELTATGGMRLYVRDNGAGMAPDQIPRALSPFEQVHDRTRTPEVGTGLGLPLTRALIELHDGQFSIESAVGKGTRIDLTFPPARVSQAADGEGD